MREILTRFRELPYRLDMLHERVTEIRNAMYAWKDAALNKPEPGPLVVVIIEGFLAESVQLRKAQLEPETFHLPGGYTVMSGLKLTDKRVAMSVSHRAPNFFSFQPNTAIGNLRVGVLCDLERVRIDDIIVANIHLSPTEEAAPWGFFDGIIGPENRITIRTSLR